MLSTKRNDLYFIFLMLTLLMGGWLFQKSVWLNWDVNWDLLVTKKLLAGGTYSHDFFDMNPPLLFFLYMPVIALQTISQIPLDLALRIYVFSLAVMSWCVCRIYLREIFYPQNVFLGKLLLVSLGFIFLIAPSYEFAQREHLLILFSFPYFLLVITRLQGKAISPISACLIGLFSFFGFAIKPYFLMSVLLVELYVVWQRKNLLASLRPETLTLGIACVLYVIATWIFFPDFLQTVVPLMFRYYHDGFTDTTSQLWDFVPLYACWIALILNLLIIKKHTYQHFNAICLLALSGFLFSYFIQHTQWYYHILPAYAFALLLITFVLGIAIKQYAHQTILISIMISLSISYIFWVTYTTYLYMAAYKHDFKNLISFMSTHAKQQDVMLFSSSGNSFFPQVYYSDVKVASRFMHFFWMPALVKETIAQPLATKSKRQLEDQTLFMNDLAEDLSAQQPKLVFVDIRKYKPYFFGYQFEYLPYLLTNQHFKAAWENYHYLTTIRQQSTWNKDKTLYKYAVYERNN